MHQKKRKTKYYTFLLVPDNERTTHSVRISLTIIRLLFISLLFVIILIVFGLVTYWPLASKFLDYQEVQKENSRLKKGLAKVEELYGDLERMKKFDQKLRSSMSGYVKVVDNASSPSETDLFEQTEQERALYSSIPTLFPVDGFYTITRGFEIGSFLKEPHLAIDIAGNSGSPVKATADGVVVFSGWTHQEGNVVILQHKFGYMSFYKHNMKNVVQRMEQVSKGQVIALLGGSGEITSGVHLHFEVWKDSKPIDPMQIISSEK
jgi:murein DD-endopeptidase MepM/ murein hydrolase activator NlpD